MFSRTFRLSISSTWRPVSTQCRSWLAELSKNARVASVARSYFRDIKVDETLNDVDDALELVYFMQRFSYPRETKLETSLKSWLSQKGANLDFSQLLDVARYLLEDSTRSDSIRKSVREHWTRIVLAEPWFDDQVKVIVKKQKEISVADCVLISRALCHSQHGVVANSFNSSLAIALAKQVKASKNLPVKEICNITEFVLPLADGTDLGSSILESFESLPLLERVLVLSTAIRSNPSNHVFHRDCLSKIVEMDKTLDVMTSLQCCHQLLLCSCCCFDKQSFEKFCVHCVENLLNDEDPSRSIERAKVDMLCEVLFQAELLQHPITARAAERLLSICKGSTDEEFVGSAFRGLAILQRKSDALSLLKRIAEMNGWKDPATQPSPISSRYVVHGLAALGQYDKSLFDPCFRTFLQDPSQFSAADVAFLVFVASQLSEPYPMSVFDQFTARITSATKFQRTDQPETDLSPQQLALLLKGLATVKYAVTSNEKLVQFISHNVDNCASSFSISECLSLVAVIYELRFSSLEKVLDSLLLNIAASLVSAPASVAVDVALVLSRVGMRNVSLLNAAGSRLKVTNPPISLLVNFILALRSLRMQQALKKLDLASLIVESHLALSDDSVLILFSSRDKHKFRDMSTAKLSALKTSTLLMLLSLVENVEPILCCLKKRDPCETLDTDILVRSVLRCTNTADVATVLELGTCGISELSANEMSQICDRIFGLDSTAPNAVFRLIGKRIFQLSETMLVENAVACLALYAKSNVRDDKVIKSLCQRLSKLHRSLVSSNEHAKKARFCFQKLGTQWATSDLIAGLNKTSLQE